ncbi:MAG: response regulator [Gammaproteobacteria bacterium]|nr:response regulator [Gammaproteobacteria bacterium]
MSTPFTILLVDDHILFRSGLKFLLEGLNTDIRFLEADSCGAALAIGKEQAPDLILLDYHLPDSAAGFDTLTEVKQHYEGATTVLLSSEDNPAIIRGAVEAGAAGFIPKSSTPEILIAALKLVLAGGVYLPPNAYTNHSSHTEATQQGESAKLANSAMGQLTERQFEVLMSAVKGKSNKVIARELDISEATVKAHLSVAFKVLDVKNRTEAVFTAAKLGLVHG